MEKRIRKMPSFIRLLVFILVFNVLLNGSVVNAAGSPWPERFSIFTEISAGSSSSGYIKAAQRFLMCYNYSTYQQIIYNGGTDGIFGNATYQSARTFQQNEGLYVDGVIGTNSWTKMADLLLLATGGTGEIKYFLSSSLFYLDGRYIIAAFIYPYPNNYIEYYSYLSNDYMSSTPFRQY